MIRSFYALAASAVVASAATLADVCTTTYAQAALPANGLFGSIVIDPSSVVVSAVTNGSVFGSNMFPDAEFEYCSVTFAYSHTGRNDQVLVEYWLPSPANFKNRYLSTGGGGMAINSGTMSLPGGIMYGAVAGLTDGGFGSFNTQFDSVFLLANGTINYESLFMFGYQAHHELTIIGKQFTRNFFKMASNTKLYAYYQACSEGGREGWSQIQRFGDDWDGAITGAPAFRFSFQQIQHLYSNVVEQTLGYYPPQCELDKIVNVTIAACDGLDGKKDGVVSRTDLCGLEYDLKTAIGAPYSCPATAASCNPFMGCSPAIPAQVGKITAQGVAVASKIIDGLHDSSGKRVYLSYQPAASFADAATAYDASTNTWGLSVTGIGAEFATRFLELKNTSAISVPDFANVTYDTLKEWIIEGWEKYEDTLQTNWPDLTPFQQAGGKVLHFHGESDNSIPTASSVRYHESVRQIMYPGMSYNDSTAALGEWYRLFLVPGAAHCAPNPLQPNGPFPQTNLAVLINWVEKGVVPTTLNATYLAGSNLGQNAQICAWPLRPLWKGNNSAMECVYDQKSIDSWNYNFDAIKMPVY